MGAFMVWTYPGSSCRPTSSMSCDWTGCVCLDIPEKLITMQIYLQGGKPAWGTSIYRKVGIFQTVPFVHNTGWLSLNKSPLIHGVRENVVDGIRKSVIINYVVGEWRDKEQLY